MRRHPTPRDVSPFPVQRRVVGHDARRATGDGYACDHVSRHYAARSDRDVVADSHCFDDADVRADIYVVPNRGGLAVIAANRGALGNIAIRTEHGGFIDHDAAKMRNEEARTNRGSNGNDDSKFSLSRTQLCPKHETDYAVPVSARQAKPEHVVEALVANELPHEAFQVDSPRHAKEVAFYQFNSCFHRFWQPLKSLHLRYLIPIRRQDM
jgi:hypothetical protein